MPVPGGARHLWVEGYREAVCGAHGAALLVTRRVERVTCRRCQSTKMFTAQSLIGALVAAANKQEGSAHAPLYS